MGSRSRRRRRRLEEEEEPEHHKKKKEKKKDWILFFPALSRTCVGRERDRRRTIIRAEHLGLCS